MVKKLSLVLLALLLIPLVFAVDTSINVKTLPNSRVEVYVLSPSGPWTRIESFFGKSNDNGEIAFISTASILKIDVALIVKDLTDKKLFYERYENYDIGNPINLVALVEDTTQIEENISEEIQTEENITEENISEEIEVQIVEKNDSGITGLAIFGENGVLSGKTPYIVIGIIAGLVVIAVIVWIIVKAKKNPQNIKVVSMQNKMQQIKEVKEVIRNQEQSHDDELKNAEARLRQAQADIERLRNKGKVEQLESRMTELANEIARLKGE